MDPIKILTWGPKWSIKSPPGNPPTPEPMLVANDMVAESEAVNPMCFVNCGEYTPYMYGVPAANATNADTINAVNLFGKCDAIRLACWWR